MPNRPVQDPNSSGPIDFTALSALARTAATKENLDRLWGAMFALPQWSFVPIPGPAGQFSPYAGVVGGQRWVMAFTDVGLAQTYAVAARIAMPGAAPLLTLSPRAAVVHLPAMRALGVTGVLVNPGPDAFFTPFENLRQMLDYFVARPAMPPPAPPAPPQGTGWDRLGPTPLPPHLGPSGFAPTLPISPPRAAAPAPPPPEPLPTQRLGRDELLALVQAAADDSARVPYAIAALRLEPEWYVIATTHNPSLPALEIWTDGRMAAQVYTDERTAQTMTSLMSPVPGEGPPLMTMSPERALERFAHEDMVELVVFNPRGEQLLVALAQLA